MADSSKLIAIFLIICLMCPIFSLGIAGDGGIAAYCDRDSDCDAGLTTGSFLFSQNVVWAVYLIVLPVIAVLLWGFKERKDEKRGVKKPLTRYAAFEGLFKKLCTEEELERYTAKKGWFG